MNDLHLRRYRCTQEMTNACVCNLQIIEGCTRIVADNVSNCGINFGWFTWQDIRVTV